MSNTHFGLSEEMTAYVRANTLRDHPLLAALREETARMAEGRMQITPEQGQFLGLLLELTGAERVLEIGTFTGYSAMAMALALPEGGRVVACDVSAEWTGIGARYWREAGVGHKIDLRLAPALETLATLQAGSFDLAFIDADKTNYDSYYEACLRLVRPGGLVAIDNVLWSGKVADATQQDAETVALRRLNQKIQGDERVTQVLLPIGDGLTLARRR